ncbi:MAG: hypothetical protein ABIT38_18870 [Gemmatimonadaceae bacterium]
MTRLLRPGLEGDSSLPGQFAGVVAMGSSIEATAAWLAFSLLLAVASNARP